METDEELLGRIGRGDTEAFDAFHARWREAVLRHAERILRDANAAEDVTQEAFLRVWRKAGLWGRRGSARGWILRIATNLSLDLLETRRKAGRRARRPGEEEETEDLLERIADGEEGWPERIMEREESIRLVRDSVERLPEAKRRVVDLYLREDVTLADIAERLDLPLGTVKSRFHYAVRELRELMDGLEEKEDP